MNNAMERQDAILNNRPALFEIKQRQPNYKPPSSTTRMVRDYLVQEAKDLRDDIFNIDYLGRKAVKENNETIREISQKHNFDPDVIRAVMFAENARGHKGGLNKAADLADLSKSRLPMNIQQNRWAGLINKRPEELKEKSNNIEAAVILLKRITQRINKPTVSKIGTLWNDLDNQNTNAFGEYINEVYNTKPWQKED
jgi:hypothetical protein